MCFQITSVSKIDLLKLDCEGAEYNILYNTPAHLFKKINCISIETHPGPDKKENKDALEKFLCRYRVHHKNTTTGIHLGV